MQLCPEHFTHDGGSGIMKDKATRDQILKEMTTRGIKEREVIPYLCCAKAFLSPEEAFDFILKIFNIHFLDTMAYNSACEILQKLAPQVDLSGIIDNFPNEDSIRRSLILNCIPLPFNEDYIPFVFEAAKSEIFLNRCSFLNLIYKMKDQTPPISPNLTNMIRHTLIKFSEELLTNSIPVQCVWLKPAFHYLKDNNNFPSFLNTIIRNGDPEVKAALGLHFSEAYEITKEVLELLSDKSPRVVAATIPSLASLDLDDKIISPIFLHPSHIVRVLILRNIKSIPKDAIDNYMRDPSDEVRIDLIRYLGSNEKGAVYAEQLFKEVKVSENDSWRKSFELLSMPFDILQKVGQDAFAFAIKKVQCHPLKLMKQAVAVLASFAKVDSAYAQVVEQLMVLLEKKGTTYSLQAFNLLQKEKDESNMQA